MTPDWDMWRFLWEVMITVIAFGSAIYAWLTRRHSVNKTAIEAVDERAVNRDDARKADIADCKVRLITLEQAVIHAPKADDLQRLRDAIADFSRELEGYKGMTSTLQRSVERMNSFLMERAK